MGSSLAGYPQAVLPPKETCRTVYEDQSNRRCSTSYEQECSISYSQSCSTEYVNECSTEYTKLFLWPLQASSPGEVPSGSKGILPTGATAELQKCAKGELFP